MENTFIVDSGAFIGFRKNKYIDHHLTIDGPNPDDSPLEQDCPDFPPISLDLASVSTSEPVPLAVLLPLLFKALPLWNHASLVNYHVINSSLFMIYFSFDLRHCINNPTVHLPTPLFSKANRHWIRCCKKTPLYGRYHSFCHLLVCCVFTSVHQVMFCVSQLSWFTWFIHSHCFCGFVFMLSCYSFLFFYGHPSLSLLGVWGGSRVILEVFLVNPFHFRFFW